MNDHYGETLTYWYLRLNGFFPLSRFVIHRDRAQAIPVDQCPADSDLLAVRLPAVYELVGGGPNHWDDRLFTSIAARPDETTVAVIVEVKGGSNADDPGEAFSERRLDYALKRIGKLTPGYNREQAKARLEGNATYTTPDRTAVVAKVMVGTTNDPDEPRALRDFVAVPLRHVLSEIRRRVRVDEAARKRGEWNFFPSDLLQFLIWEDEIQGPQ